MIIWEIWAKREKLLYFHLSLYSCLLSEQTIIIIKIIYPLQAIVNCFMCILEILFTSWGFHPPLLCVMWKFAHIKSNWMETFSLIHVQILIQVLCRQVDPLVQIWRMRGEWEKEWDLRTSDKKKNNLNLGKCNIFFVLIWDVVVWETMAWEIFKI